MANISGLAFNFTLKLKYMSVKLEFPLVNALLVAGTLEISFLRLNSHENPKWKKEFIHICCTEHSDLEIGSNHEIKWRIKH